MSLLKYLRRQKNTAEIAKERLKIIVAHERQQQRSGMINIHELQQKLIEVIADYLKIGKDEVQINIELEKDKNRSILEMNVTLPEEREEAA